MRIICLFLLCCLAHAAPRPNVVFIMADDLGWADTSLYGHTTLHATPNLERLRARGMLFDRAYTVSPLCSPTRSAVLTGLHPARTGLTAPTCHLAGEPILKPRLNQKTPAHQPLLTLVKPNRLDTRYPSLAKALKTAGYDTAHVGKWHLGRAPFTALDHGFDVDIPNWYGPGPAGSYVAPWRFPDFKEAYPGEHIEDRMGDEIVAYLEKQVESGRPFFLNYWQFSVHGPFDAKAADIEFYRGKVDPEDGQRSPTYAAMVKALDDNVGKVLDALDRLELSDNTLIFFYSDNGGNMYSAVDGGVPTSNRPLRGGKGNNWDGGVRVPAIAVWPGRIEAGSRSRERITSTDFLPTILDLMEVEMPAGQICDGISIRPALEGGELDREHIFTYFPHQTKVPDHFPNSAAVYDEEWKLIRLLHAGPDRQHRHLLYHLKSDIGERKEVAPSHPEIVHTLSAALDGFLADTGAVYPTPNPRYTAPVRYEGKPNVILIYTDDHGWPDIGSAGIYNDLKTPHLDALAASGVRCTSGYASAPQCVPSRGGLLIGKYQNRFALEGNKDPLDGFDAEFTIAERLKTVGYATGQVGKWHLGPSTAIPRHGFDDVYAKNANRACAANFTLAGERIPMQQVNDGLYHLDACSEAALRFIDRHKDAPFFLYLAYRAPHVPLDAPKKYLARFPGEMPERRRQALAMISAMDDGVGRIVARLKRHQLSEKTLIFFIGDNGAPLKIHKLDAPGGGPGWDGSLNEPMNGEKGMLSEGGIRVPFLVAWPGMIPGGQVHDAPVIALDATATIAAQAGVELQPGDLDGINLVPQLTGQAAPKRPLYWRWIDQAAIRDGKWKLLRAGPRSYLFDLENDAGEMSNLKEQSPQIHARLDKQLQVWASSLKPPGIRGETPADVVERYFDHYLDGKPVPAPAPPGEKKAQRTDWVLRGGEGRQEQGAWIITTQKGAARSFIATTRIQTEGDLRVQLRLRTGGGGFGLDWRREGQKEFVPGQNRRWTIEGAPGAQDIAFELPAPGTIVHLRILLPPGETAIESIKITGAESGRYNWRFAK